MSERFSCRHPDHASHDTVEDAALCPSAGYGMTVGRSTGSIATVL